MGKINIIPNMDTELIKRIVSDYKVVSFDLFETLIHRYTRTPQDVFVIAERILRNRYSINITDFSKKRIAAEAEARRINKNGEVGINDIYELMDLNSTISIDKLIHAEIEAEEMLTYGDKKLKEVYEYCRESQIDVVITSNMYLDRYVLGSLLKKSGFDNDDKIFVSCEFGKNKRDGGLFKQITELIDVDPSEIIHIGDSFSADCVGASKAGISSILLLNTEQRKWKKAPLDECIVDRYIDNNVDNSKDPYHVYGYKNFGKLLAGFCQWMHSEVSNNSIRDIYFFSRDGYILKRAYSALYEKCETTNQDSKPPCRSHYLYTSRRSLRVPYLWSDMELKEIVDKFPKKNNLTVKMFMENMGLDSEGFKSEIEKAGLTKDTWLRRDQICCDKRVQVLFEIIKDYVIDNSKREYELIKEYLAQEGFNGRVAVVDIGWHGSLQYFLNRICNLSGINIEMYGYYLGLDSKHRPNDNAKGFLKDSKNSSFFDSRKPFVGLIESLFMNQEGSTKSYIKNDVGRVVPILYPYEYDDGNAVKESTCIASIHNGAIDFLDECELIKYVNLSEEFAKSGVVNTGKRPTTEDLRLFGDFRYMDVSMFYLSSPKGILDYVKKPATLKNDLEKSYWQTAFMKKLFKINLPYYTIIRALSLIRTGIKKL